MKQSGLGDYLLIDGYDFSGDIGSIGRISGGPAASDVTGITSSAMERIGLARDGGIDFTSWFNPSAGRQHDILTELPYASRQQTYLRGLGLGNQAASCVLKQIGYDPTRGQDGALSIAIAGQGDSFGVEWGLQATPGKRTDTTATNGASIDYGAVSTLFGMQAYLHVTALTGTNVVVALEDSADNVTFLPITAGAFASKTAVGFERIETGRTATIRRYVRVATTGTFTSATFAVNFIRNETLVNF
jgi:hypothetical protein